jgi:hypothetical protein
LGEKARSRKGDEDKRERKNEKEGAKRKVVRLSIHSYHKPMVKEMSSYLR